MIKKFRFFHLLILISLSLFVLAFLLCRCKHQNVMNKYKEGNTHARDLLLHGMNEKNSSHIDQYLIDKSLEGDEEAKEIVYAQIQTLGSMENSRAIYVPLVFPIHTRVR